jgi:hypothetical protein
LADLQEALNDLTGLPKRRSEDVESRERAVGHAVLKALRGLSLGEETGRQVLGFSGVLRFQSEDGGQAIIAQLPEDDEDAAEGEAVFVRVHGWDETGEHRNLKALEGLRAVVRIEVPTP